MEVPRHIILFDGVCNLCNGAVQFVIKRDRRHIFRFASLQSEAGKQLLAAFGLPEDHLKSFVYIDGEKVYTRSDAALKVAGALSYPSKLMAVFLIIPKFIRDFFYNIIAMNRYKWFGKTDACMIPTPELRQRFL
ncbi:MAG: thiol-disulfide oxidoreductase DCC family protein [Niabella sp.]